MAEITRRAVTRVEVDLSKRVFQVHAVDRGGRVLMAKPMSPVRVITRYAKLPVGCPVTMEACGSGRSSWTGHLRN